MKKKKTKPEEASAVSKLPMSKIRKAYRFLADFCETPHVFIESLQVYFLTISVFDSMKLRKLYLMLPSFRKFNIFSQLNVASPTPDLHVSISTSLHKKSVHLASGRIAILDQCTGIHEFGRGVVRAAAIRSM